jgi:hypothetical protein
VFASHVVELNRAASDGVRQQDHWEAAAARGNEAAIERLTPPDYPDCVQYLWGWAIELHGRSGVGMNGLAPLTYEAIMSWAVLKSKRPTPFEVDALMILDATLRTASGKDKEETRQESDEPLEERPWPTRKPGVEPQFVKEG